MRVATVPAEEVLDEGVHVGEGVVYRNLDDAIHAPGTVELESELDPGCPSLGKG